MLDIIDKYDVLDNDLGSGNFGKVYKVHNKVVNRIEAVKIVQNVSNSFDKDVIEAKVQHKLKHNNVVEIYDAFIRNNKLYIIMEFLANGTVEKLMKENGKLSIKQSIKISLDVLHGMQYIHNNHYIHRDLKPSNILISADNIAKLSDFGLTSELDDEGKYRSGFGYNIHKPPEVLKEEGYCIESDIFAFGLTLYRMLNGDSFLEQYKRKEIPYLIYNGKFPPTDNFSPDVSNKLRRIIKKSLSYNPTNRYSNAHSMRSELNKICIPIEWNLITSNSKKTLWSGKDTKRNYRVEVISSKSSGFDVIVKKGIKMLRIDNSLCRFNINRKELDKYLRIILTKKLV